MVAIRAEYDKFMKIREDKAKENPMAARMMDSKLHPGKLYVHPVKMFGNLWYVGDSSVCAHLIDTGDGLLLFDTVNVGQGGMLINAIWEAGFNPANIKWIIHSHGHIDHIGQAIFMKDMFGCKLGLGAPDAEMFKNEPQKAFMHQSDNPYDTLFEPDFVINDGDVMKFGNTEIKFVMVPGHTDGCIAAFFDVKEGDKTLRAGYYGGFGYNTLQKDYLLSIGDTEYTKRQVYIDSIDKVINEKVDIFMGNHPINNDMLGKIKKLKENPDVNPFIDSTEWRKYLQFKRDGAVELLNDPAQK